MAYYSVGDSRAIGMWLFASKSDRKGFAHDLHVDKGSHAYLTMFDGDRNAAGQVELACVGASSAEVHGFVQKLIGSGHVVGSNHQLSLSLGENDITKNGGVLNEAAIRATLDMLPGHFNKVRLENYNAVPAFAGFSKQLNAIVEEYKAKWTHMDGAPKIELGQPTTPANQLHATDAASAAEAKANRDFLGAGETRGVPLESHARTKASRDHASAPVSPVRGRHHVAHLRRRPNHYHQVGAGERDSGLRRKARFHGPHYGISYPSRHDGVLHPLGHSTPRSHPGDRRKQKIAFSESVMTSDARDFGAKAGRSVSALKGGSHKVQAAVAPSIG